MAKAAIRPGIEPWVAELGEDLSAGDPVYVVDDSGAKVKKVFTDVGDYVQLDADGYEIANCVVDTDIVVTVFRNRVGGILQAQAVNVDTGQKGTMVSLDPSSIYYPDCCKIDTLKFVATYRAGSRVKAIAATVDGTTLAITAGTAVNLSAADGYYGRCCPIDTTRFGCAWRHTVSPTDCHTIISSVSGTTITPDAAGEVTFNYGANIYYPTCAYRAGFFIIVLRGAGYDLYAKASTLSGTTLGGFPAGNGTLLHAGTVYPTDLFLVGSKFISMFRDGSYHKAHVFMNMGPTISPGNTTQLSDSYSYYGAGVATDNGNNQFIGVYTRDVSPYEGRYKLGITPSDEITFDNYVRWWATRAYKVDVCGLVNGADWEVAISMIESTSYDVYVFKLGSEGDQFGKCCGILEQGGSLGDRRLVTPLGGITKTISGTPGDVMYIQSDTSISNVKTDYPIALIIDSGKALIGKDIIQS